MPALQKEIGRRVRAARKRLGLTQRELAEQLELEEVSVRAVEAGRRGLSVDSVVRYAAVLHRPPGALLEDADQTQKTDEVEAGRIIRGLGEPWRTFAMRLLRDVDRTCSAAARAPRKRG